MIENPSSFAKKKYRKLPNAPRHTVPHALRMVAPLDYFFSLHTTMAPRPKKKRRPSTPLYEIDKRAKHYNYMLDGNYIGWTTNPIRRQRQHQRKIKKGAKATARMAKRNPNLAIGILVSGFLNKRDALKHEKAWQKKRSKQQRLDFVASRDQHRAGHKWSKPSIPVDHPLRKGRPLHVIYIGGKVLHQDAALPTSSALRVYGRAESLEQALTMA
jgi:predicted GIY-YIG superfamily endonuclease